MSEREKQNHSMKIYKTQKAQQILYYTIVEEM